MQLAAATVAAGAVLLPPLTAHLPPLPARLPADKKTIKSSYRQLARKFHPDVNKEADAEQRFKDISAAYEVGLPPAEECRRALFAWLGWRARPVPKRPCLAGWICSSAFAPAKEREALLSRHP